MDASALSDEQGMFAVDGVRLPRPFRIRRLGHFGFNCDALGASLDFYRRLLGFRLSDTIDYRDLTPEPERLDGLGDTKGYFLRYGTDHHALVLFNRAVRTALDTQGRFRPGVTINQITWQVNSLEEVVRAAAHLEASGVRMSRSGRDTPGSNWHTYFFDPDGHTIELYYGIEQIGWDGCSKPKAMYNRGFKAAPPLPQMAEADEVAEALAAGIDLTSGHSEDPLKGTYDVGGVRLPRPFAIAGIGPVRIFVADLEAACAFYTDVLGLAVSARTRLEGLGAVFLRAGSEHHAVALYDLRLRARLPVRQDTTTLSFGLKIAGYAQLRAACRWLADAGYAPIDLPSELFPGARHTAVFADPDGHLVQLYSEMEQVGWDGRTRDPPLLPDLRPERWPPLIEPLSDTFAGEPFLGPWL